MTLWGLRIHSRPQHLSISDNSTERLSFSYSHFKIYIIFFVNEPLCFFYFFFSKNDKNFIFNENTTILVQILSDTDILSILQHLMLKNGKSCLVLKKWLVWDRPFQVLLNTFFTMKLNSLQKTRIDLQFFEFFAPEIFAMMRFFRNYMCFIIIGAHIIFYRFGLKMLELMASLHW